MTRDKTQQEFYKLKLDCHSWSDKELYINEFRIPNSHAHTHTHLYTYVHKHILPHICKAFASLQSTYICFI